MDSNDFLINGEVIQRGEKKVIQLPLAKLYDFTDISMTVAVIRGNKPGPTIFISGAVHGDEIIGSEVIKRLLSHKRLKIKKGTLLAIPIVNAFGFNNRSRYFPDRRDLNRVFPGNPLGSLAARVAHQFVREIIKKSDYGIDIHSGAIHRFNLPQIRACLNNPETKKLAQDFEVPVILNSKLRDGSIRSIAEENNVNVLLFEGGEALRFDERVIKIALRGILSVLESIKMIEPLATKLSKPKKMSYIAESSYWVRAPQSGTMKILRTLGSHVQKGCPIAIISDIFGKQKKTIYTKSAGVIIGENKLPLINHGDAIVHIATFEPEEILNPDFQEHLEIFEDNYAS